MNVGDRPIAGQRRMMSKWNWLSALLCLVACYTIAPGAALSQDAGRNFYSAEMISDRLNQPTGFAHAQDDLLYIMERGGQIRILQDGEIRRSPFFDLSDLVSSGASIEQGLLGLAFDPQYPDNSVANPDQADHWGAMGIGDACDQAFYFAKRDRSEVKMFQQHYGAYHFYACRAGNCGLLAMVDPAALGEDPVLRLVNEELGWSLEAAFAAESAGRRIYAVSIFAEDGGIFADDLQLLLAGADLSWRTAS